MIKPHHIGYERIWTGTVGKFDYTYYTRDDLTDPDPEKVRDVQGWLNGLDEPWSPTAVSYNIHPSYEKIFIYYIIIKLHGFICYQFARGGVLTDIYRAMRLLGYLPAVHICSNLALVQLTYCVISKIIYIVSYS